MRDPEGRLHITPRGVERLLHAALPGAHFLHSAQAAALVEQGQLIGFSIEAPDRIHSPLIEFVSLPAEWPDAQLRAAADLTLAIARQVLAAGFELKDASAWNVVFDGTVPRFCDHLSFQPIASRQWWAFGQFVRHFVFPLGVSERTGLRGHQIFRFHRDGLAPQEVRALLGLRRFATRLWPLMGDPPQGGDGAGARPGRALHGNLYNFCEWSLGRNGKARRRGHGWRNYTGSRSHYSTSASEGKLAQVGQWLQRTAPGWVADLGCNTGEYTRLAARLGARVIALDSDHDCVEQLFLSEAGNTAIHPVLANLADVSGGGGWGGTEYGGLVARLQGKVDLVMMLALIHHLAVSESIPLPRIAELAAGITRRWAIVEYIGADDPLLARLAQQRRREPLDFAIGRQRAAFALHFDTVAEFAIGDTCRTLALLEKKR